MTNPFMQFISTHKERGDGTTTTQRRPADENKDAGGARKSKRGKACMRVHMRFENVQKRKRG